MTAKGLFSIFKQKLICDICGNQCTVSLKANSAVIIKMCPFSWLFDLWSLGGLYTLLIYFTNHYRICAIVLWYLLENERVEKQMKKILY